MQRRSLSIAGLKHFQLGNKFSVFPKIGLAYARIDSGNDACVTYSDDSDVSLLYGIGGEFRILERFSVRADVDKGSSGLDDEKLTTTIGFSFHF